MKSLQFIKNHKRTRCIEGKQLSKRKINEILSQLFEHRLAEMIINFSGASKGKKDNNNNSIKKHFYDLPKLWSLAKEMCI